MARQTDPDKILDECRKEVQKGLGKKTLHPLADADLVKTYRQGIVDRLKIPTSDWDTEKTKGPLAVAFHLGQICAILSVGDEVTPAVAKAAAIAVRSDENCPPGGGTGQWCV